MVTRHLFTILNLLVSQGSNITSSIWNFTSGICDIYHLNVNTFGLYICVWGWLFTWRFWGLLVTARLTFNWRARSWAHLQSTFLLIRLSSFHSWFLNRSQFLSRRTCYFMWRFWDRTRPSPGRRGSGCFGDFFLRCLSRHTRTACSFSLTSFIQQLLRSVRKQQLTILVQSCYPADIVTCKIVGASQRI